MLEMGLKIDLFLFSPPYNQGNKRKRKDGQRGKGEYDACSHGSPNYPDNLPEPVWKERLIEAVRRSGSCLSPNGLIICNTKPKRVNFFGDKIEESADEWLVPALKPDLLKHGKLILVRGSPISPKDAEDKNIPINSIIGISTHNNEPTLPNPTYEEATIFKKPKSKPYYNNEISEIFTTSNNVVPFPPVRTKEPHHSAPFSLHFSRQQVFRWCPSGGLVCDIYSGGGTTMLACCYEKRGFIGSELIENNCQMTKERILKEINNIQKNYYTIKTY
jgi:DNA modification methylase